MGLAVAFGLLFFVPAGASNANHPVSTILSSDYTELAMLAGDCDSAVNLTSAALDALGWERGVFKRYNVDPTGSRDLAMTFIKGDHCVAAFSATNDPTDTLQVMGGFQQTPVDMCGFQVHAGVAQEMASFLGSAAYADFVAFLNDAKCKHVTAVGHSLGGSLATLWAACANVGAKISVSNDVSVGFGARSDYALVTIGPFATTTTPVYNGKPDVPFIGMRYSLTESDGGISAQTGFHVDTKSFRIQLIELYGGIAQKIGQADIAASLANQKSKLSNMSTEEIEGLWPTDVYPILKEFVLYSLANGNKDAAMQDLTKEFAASGVVSFEYDPISSIAGFFGFKHALQDFQPLPNKLVAARDGSSMAMVPAGSATDLPKCDLFQALFGTLAYNGWFPNHATCCYGSQANEVCSSQYDQPQFRVCQNPTMVYMPNSTTTRTDIGEASQAQVAHFAPHLWMVLMLIGASWLAKP